MSDGLAIAMNVRKAMQKKKMAEKPENFDDGGMMGTAMKAAPIAMMLLNKGGDVPDEHDEDLMEPKEADEPLMEDAEESATDEKENMMAKGGMNEKLHPMAKYAHGGMHMSPMSMVKAIRMKKMAAGGMFEDEGDSGAMEANEAEGKRHSMNDWLSSGDSDLEEESADSFEKKKARIRSALMSVSR